jgi:hypothetical protein
MLEALASGYGEALLWRGTWWRFPSLRARKAKKDREQMSRLLYHREWVKKHPGYKTADSRLRALFRPAKRPFFREILGVKVRVNLLAKYNAAHPVPRRGFGFHVLTLQPGRTRQLQQVDRKGDFK